ncbi:LexA family transcriptional regulator [Rhodospira trueperi]|uniref:Phage repressor protein C, contains Cro/C1-type HTH and peptisase s24 domains n=1 Tax=Rhodospira trueperi TaxID=69960 RepID=A0A1G7D2Z3_9PROT|nr:LexA family transcriptional regulator [Rhodospira trueperi]SDE45962.1 Phage repressor protein C, contains Cro/C1-type HTH and peptisase s24 domains [Rhodospira trueperi]
MDVIEWIKEGLDNPAKSRIGLADALGRNSAVVTRILQGKRRLKADEIPAVAAYLELEPPPEVARVMIERTEDMRASGRDLPIYSSARGGRTGMIVTFDPIEYVTRPEPLRDVRGAFGMYVVGDSMAPAYRQGDMVLIHPHRPVNQGDDVLLVKEDGDGVNEAMVKALIAMTDDEVRVRQYNPPRDLDPIPRAEVRNVMLIVGCYRKG